MDGRISFQRDGLPIGKSISLKQYLKLWKRQVDDVFFVWSGSKDDLELFVWHLNGTGKGKLSTVFGCRDN